MREKSNTRHEQFKWLSRGSNQRGRSPSATKQLKRTAPIPLGQEQGAARRGERTEEITVELLKWEAGPKEV